MPISSSELFSIVLLHLYTSIHKESKCKGLCQAFCGPQWMSKTEYENIPSHLRQPKPDFALAIKQCGAREDAFYKQQPIPEPACGYLTTDGKCSIYAYRPFVCRTRGSNHNQMNRCPYGCEETLSDSDWQSLYTHWLNLIEIDASVEEIDIEASASRLNQLQKDGRLNF